MKEKWTEADILAQPEGQEHDYLERKSGRLLDNRHDFRTALSKAISAFANSGGGHIVLGQQDDGTIDGLPQQEGRTSIREWLEQIIPNLVQYPLEAFRVHRVEKDSTSSQIPQDRELVVIDIGDSRLAPHQAAVPADDRRYYYREGGRSVPAPHHYLEALRNRLTAAVLEAGMSLVSARRSYPDETNSSVAIIEIQLNFEVKNISLVASYKWDVSCRFHGNVDTIVPRALDKRIGTGLTSISLDDTILPTKSQEKSILIGWKVRLGDSIGEQIKESLKPLEVEFWPISETSIGSLKTTQLSDCIDDWTLEAQIEESLRQAGLLADGGQE